MVWEPDRVMVLADVDLIHQVVYNLIDNAVRFLNDVQAISSSAMMYRMI